MISKELENQHPPDVSSTKGYWRISNASTTLKETMASLSAETGKCTQVLKNKKSELDSIIEETKQEGAYEACTQAKKS